MSTFDPVFVLLPHKWQKIQTCEPNSCFWKSFQLEKEQFKDINASEVTVASVTSVCKLQLYNHTFVQVFSL